MAGRGDKRRWGLEGGAADPAAARGGLAWLLVVLLQTHAHAHTVAARRLAHQSQLTKQMSMAAYSKTEEAAVRGRFIVVVVVLAVVEAAATATTTTTTILLTPQPIR